MEFNCLLQHRAPKPQPNNSKLFKYPYKQPFAFYLNAFWKQLGQNIFLLLLLIFLNFSLTLTQMWKRCQTQALIMSTRDVSLDYQMKTGTNLKDCFEQALPYQENPKPITNEHDTFTVLMGTHLTFVSGSQKLRETTWTTCYKS